MALAGPWHLTPGTTLQDGVITSTDGAVVDMIKINDEVVYVDMARSSLTWPPGLSYVDPLKDEADFTLDDIRWTAKFNVTPNGQAWLRRLFLTSAAARHRSTILHEIRSRRAASEAGRSRRR